MVYPVGYIMSSVNPLVRELDEERKRLGMTKAQLAARCGLASISVRKIFTATQADIKLSTVAKIAEALGATLELRKIDHGVDDDRASYLVRRLSRRHLAEQIAIKNGVDAGDVEHVLHNLDLTPTDRLVRSLSRGRLKRHRR
jgi:transcriptional regulator with XRE-family HTH domain